MLRDDIVMKNGILRRRFLRELTHLKKMADYASCDPTNLNNFLYTLGPEFCVYTYEMLKNGIDRDTLFSINEEQLLVWVSHHYFSFTNQPLEGLNSQYNVHMYVF